MARDQVDEGSWWQTIVEIDALEVAVISQTHLRSTLVGEVNRNARHVEAGNLPPLVCEPHRS